MLMNGLTIAENGRLCQRGEGRSRGQLVGANLVVFIPGCVSLAKGTQQGHVLTGISTRRKW